MLKENTCHSAGVKSVRTAQWIAGVDWTIHNQSQPSGGLVYSASVSYIITILLLLIRNPNDQSYWPITKHLYRALCTFPSCHPITLEPSTRCFLVEGIASLHAIEIDQPITVIWVTWIGKSQSQISRTCDSERLIYIRVCGVHFQIRYSSVTDIDISQSQLPYTQSLSYIGNRSTSNKHGVRQSLSSNRLRLHPISAR